MRKTGAAALELKCSLNLWTILNGICFDTIQLKLAQLMYILFWKEYNREEEMKRIWNAWCEAKMMQGVASAVGLEARESTETLL